MSKIKIAGNAVIVESDLALEDIKTVKKYRPSVLVLNEEVDGVKEPVFAIDVAGNTMGSLDCYGAVFGGSTEEGNALITMIVGGEAANIKKWVGENLTGAIMNLNKIEKVVSEALESIKADQKAVMDSITMA